MATKKSVDQVWDENSEASRSRGVRPKGTASARSGKVTVVHKKAGSAMKFLSRYQLTVIATNTVAGLVMIYAYLPDPAIQAHAMWAYGIANAIAAVPCFLNKRE